LQLLNSRRAWLDALGAPSVASRPFVRCPAAIVAVRVKREAGVNPALPPQR